jgi:hypothetical protein
MRNPYMISLLAIAAGLATAPMAMHDANALPESGGFLRERRGKGRNNKRGKGLQARPRKHSNRVTISKRVRRKHRRAA